MYRPIEANGFSPPQPPNSPRYSPPKAQYFSPPKSSVTVTFTEPDKTKVDEIAVLRLLDLCTNNAQKVEALDEFALILNGNPPIKRAINDTPCPVYSGAFQLLVKSVMTYLPRDKVNYAPYLAIKLACTEASGKLSPSPVAYELSVRGQEELEELYVEDI